MLVVDDEALLRMSLRERLAREDYDLLEAGPAAEALERLTSEPDLVSSTFTCRTATGRRSSAKSRIAHRIRLPS